MTDRVYNVLFLCTANSVRSIVAEMILNLESNGRFKAFSAGTRARGQVDTNVLSLGHSLGYDVATLRSKGVEEFSQAGAPDIDLVIALSDDAAGEVRPEWLGHPATAHWDFPDLIESAQDAAAHQKAMRQEFRQLAERIHFLLLLSETSLDRMSLETHARQAAVPT